MRTIRRTLPLLVAVTVAATVVGPGAGDDHVALTTARPWAAHVTPGADVVAPVIQWWKRHREDRPPVTRPVAIPWRIPPSLPWRSPAPTPSASSDPTATPAPVPTDTLTPVPSATTSAPVVTVAPTTPVPTSSLPTEVPTALPTAVPTVPTVPVTTVPTVPTTVPTTAPTTTPSPAWASGVFVPGGSPSAVNAFGAWRGRAVDVVTTWVPRTTWSDFTDPQWLWTQWRDQPQTVSLGIPPIPADGASTLSACAAGTYDRQWQTFAASAARSGLADRLILRLGWEFNGDWYAWSAAKDPAAFAACWRRVHDVVETVVPAVRWDWNVNRGVNALADPTRAYPGDAYVDYVGVDSYDMWPGATSAAAWNQQLNGAYGLAFWRGFAAAHGKQLSVPEWGVYPGTASAGANGGDNPFYVARMAGFFASLGSGLAYEAYFNESAPYYAGSLFAPAQNPLAAAEYRRIFR